MLHPSEPHRGIMGEVSEKDFYAAFNALGADLRDHLDRRFNALDRKLDAHAADDLMVANRVLTIEVERKKEFTSATTRMTWTVAGMTTGATILMEIVKHFFK